MRVFDFDRAIVRQPANTVVNGLRKGDRESPSYEGIVREHAAYVAALRRAGLDVMVLPPLPDYPDSIFVEDAALVLPEGVILLRPGAPSRREEVAALSPTLQAQFGKVMALSDGRADGGDVLVTHQKVIIGLSGRTDRDGAENLLDMLARMGRVGEITSTPAGTLHLKSACSLIDEETILSTRQLAATGIFKDFRTILVPQGEESGANVLRVNDTIFAAEAFPTILDLLDGYAVELVPLTVEEIGRIDAGLTCMSLRWSKASCQ